ncbi:MAG: hypothetical protein CVU04_05075, partial [Bacteroidetes bacterium HGW-Bacteroidetes-20]
MMNNDHKSSRSKINTFNILKIKYLFFLLLILGFARLQAQSTVNTAGGDGSGNGGSVSFSVGQ